MRERLRLHVILQVPRYLAGGSHLAREKTVKLVGSFDDGAVARQVGLRRQDVESLPAAQGARDAVHRKHRGAL